MRLLFRTLLVVLVVVLLLAGAGFLLVGTERGTTWTLERVVGLLPIDVEAEAPAGTLLGGLRIGRLQIESETVRIRAMNVRARLDWSDSVLRNRLVLEAVSVDELSIARKLPASDGPKPFAFELPRLPVTIEIVSLSIDVLATDWVPANYAGRVTASGLLSNEVWRVANLDFRSPALKLRGNLSANTAMDPRLPLVGRLDLRVPDRDVVGVVDVGGDLESLRLAVEMSSPWRATGTVRVALLGQMHPDVDGSLALAEWIRDDMRASAVTADWHAVLVAPIALEVEARAGRVEWGERAATDLQAQLAGSLNDYSLSAAAAIVVPGLPEGDFQLVARGDELELTDIDARFSTASGTLHGRGNATAAPFTANLVVDVDGLTPGYFIAGVSGDLSGRSVVAIAQSSLSLEIESLEGTINEQPLTVQGRVTRDGDVWRIDRGAFRAGTNVAQVNGQWSPARFDVRAEFDLPSLSTLYPDIVGDARGRLILGGTAAEPDVDISVDSSSITISAIAVDGLIARAAIRRGRVERGVATASTLDAFGVHANSVEINGVGDFDAMTLTTAWQIDADRSDFEWRGHYRDSELALDLMPGARLAAGGEALISSSISSVRWADDRVSVSAHCWQRDGGSGRLCVDAFTIAESSSLSGSIADLPASIVSAFVSDLPGIQGSIGGQWRFERGSNTSWRGSAELTTTGLALLELGTVDAEPVVIPDMRALVDLGADGVTIDALLGLEEPRMLELKLRIAGYDAESALSGHLQLAIDDVGVLGQFSRRIGESSGQVQGRFEVSGTRGAPSLAGKVAFTQGRFVWLDPHFEVADLDVDVSMPAPDRIEFKGSGTSGRGRVMLSGAMFEPFSSSRHARLEIDTEGLDVGIPEGTVRLDADLVLSWRASEFDLDGAVTVPRARIEVAGLPESSVRHSRDVIVVDREVARTESTRLAVDIDVTLGKDVRFAGFGLETKLGGRLRLRQSRDGGVRLDGVLTLREGAFEAFGQRLTLESGGLTFAGPADDPLISARATRTIEEPSRTVKVGVDIQGRAGAMESTLFSNPVMSDADALSYLVLGRPLSAATAQESGDVTGAAIALGLKGAAPVIDEIRGAFGLEELTATGGSTEELALIAGKRISDSVYVRYSYQTFTRMSALLVRLALTNRLSLEATAAEAPGMDLIYRVGPDG